MGKILSPRRSKNTLTEKEQNYLIDKLISSLEALNEYNLIEEKVIQKYKYDTPRAMKQLLSIKEKDGFKLLSEHDDVLTFVKGGKLK